MMKVIRKVTISMCVLTTLTGCATVPSAGPGSNELVETETSSRTKKTLLVIAGVLLTGVIIANEAEDGAKDAVRDATRPVTRSAGMR